MELNSDFRSTNGLLAFVPAKILFGKLLNKNVNSYRYCNCLVSNTKHLLNLKNEKLCQQQAMEACGVVRC
jgi:hypothetical protein